MIPNLIRNSLLPLAILAVAATACSDDQKRSLGEQDVRDSLRTSVEQILDDTGDGVDGDGLDCTSSIGSDGTVDGSCAGSTDGGEPVTAAYAGTADIDAETCTAVMTITVGATELPPDDGVDCFGVSDS
jgi:hypothetical protein